MAGREPYDALVGMGLYYSDINNTYKQKILEPSLRFYGKTTEQFDADVQAQDDDYRAWLEEYEKRKENADADIDCCLVEEEDIFADVLGTEDGN